MPSEFDSFTASALSESLDVFGRVSFTLDGTPYPNAGLLNEFDSARELEIGGFVGNFNATLLCQRSKFTETPGVPLERTLDGKLLVIDGRTFRVGKASMDESSVTLGLVHTK